MSFVSTAHTKAGKSPAREMLATRFGRMLLRETIAGFEEYGRLVAASYGTEPWPGLEPLVEDDLNAGSGISGASDWRRAISALEAVRSAKPS